MAHLHCNAARHFCVMLLTRQPHTPQSSAPSIPRATTFGTARLGCWLQGFFSCIAVDWSEELHCQVQLCWQCPWHEPSLRSLKPPFSYGCFPLCLAWDAPAHPGLVLLLLPHTNKPLTGGPFHLLYKATGIPTSLPAFETLHCTKCMEQAYTALPHYTHGAEGLQASCAPLHEWCGGLQASCAPHTGASAGDTSTVHIQLKRPKAWSVME